MKENQMIGSCGLACMLCSAKLKNECEGCTEKKAIGCDIKECVMDKKIDGCYKCDDYPCDKDMFKNLRLRTFNEVAKEEGISCLVSCLKKNDEAGIRYHTTDGSKGDYDVLATADEIKDLILNGKKS